MGYYRGDHRSQFDGSRNQNQNCVPTTGANGARVVTHGAINMSGGQVRSLLRFWEEQNPFTAGWSLDDLDKAMGKIGVGFVIHSRVSAADAFGYSDQGFAVALQGLSRVFTEGCSAKFNGGHCILLHPDTYQGLRLIGDPLCDDWRFEREIKLRQYMEQLYGADHIRFGRFTTKVPLLTPDTGTDKEDPLDPRRIIPYAIAHVGPCTVYADPDRHAVLLKSYVGGDVQLYGGPVKPLTSDGKSALASGRFDLTGGPGEDLHVGYFGVNEIDMTTLRLL